MSFIDELKRRNVVRVGVAYAVTAWLLMQFTDVLIQLLELSPGIGKTVVLFLIVGFPIALIIAWAYELTPEGIKREKDVDRSESITPGTGKKLDRMIIVALGLVVVWFLVDEFYLEPLEAENSQTVAVEQPASGQTPGAGEAQKSVAVLPFRSMSSGADDEYFSDGLTEEILNSLTALPELLVTARTSSFHFKDKDLPIPEIAATLGVEHVVEGSVRRSGEKVRITAQLIRAADGFHLWSDTYDRTLEDVFSVQEDIAAKIASTLEVVLNEDKLQQMRNAGIGDVDGFILYQKALASFADAHSISNPADHLGEANLYFDQALAIVPDIPNAHYLRSDLFGHMLYEHAAGYKNFTADELASAHEQVILSLQRAIESSDSPIQRTIYEVEKTLFSDNWFGLTDKIKRAFAAGDCSAYNWFPTIAAPYGWSAEVAQHSRDMIRCDPLNGFRFAMLGLWEAWDGNPDATRQVSRDLANTGRSHPWMDDMLFLSQLALGDFEDRATLLRPKPEGSWFTLPRKVHAMAAMGEVDAARLEIETFTASNDIDELSMLIASAGLGERQAANEYAAIIDARFGGPFVLAEAVKGCLCGAPFDLDATPNFKARIEEAGFAWPPPTRINYPAKDW